MMSELVVGKAYAYRRTRTGPFRKVKLVETTGKKEQLKIRYLDEPHPGLEEWTKARWIVVPWAGLKAFARDEERETRAREASAKEGDGPLRDAVDAILGATGEDLCLDWIAGRGDGLLNAPVEAVRRVVIRAGLEDDVERLHPSAFVDRHGDLLLPFEGAMKLARAFAVAEPENVLRHIENEEVEYKARGYEPGERYYHDRLRELSPGHALVRQWAGVEKEIEELRKEIARVRSIAESAAFDLKRLGAEREARRVERALAGR